MLFNRSEQYRLKLRFSRWRFFGMLLGLTISMTLIGTGYFGATSVHAQEAAGARADRNDLGETTSLSLPWIYSGKSNTSGNPSQDSNGLLCRFGVNAPSGVMNYPVDELRVGWYQNYATSLNPDRPQGMEFVQMIRLSQPGADRYTFTPSASVISQIAALNPGAIWFVGNEPDREFYQDGIDPDLYAQAYHELYSLVKETDPTARLFAGSIVQPTRVRLLYLDKVLAAYRNHYGVSMPVDGWSIHNFILNEASCDAFPGDCWGADIPPGVDEIEGLRIDVQDHDSFDRFVEQIEGFRKWMWLNGYQDTPLYLSEYGVLMPQGLFEPDFTETRVNLYMKKTFDYLLTTTHSQYGYQPDGNRLVQRLSWFSTDYTDYNGQLFDRTSGALTGIGLYYKNYTSAIQETVDFSPIKIVTNPTMPVYNGDLVTVTVTAQIANSGNALAPQEVEVSFYDGEPGAGGIQIGETQSVLLSGCGSNAWPSVTWPNLDQGHHSVYVVVSGRPNGLEEKDTALVNNQLSQVIMVATEQIFLPALSK